MIPKNSPLSWIFDEVLESKIGERKGYICRCKCHKWNCQVAQKLNFNLSRFSSDNAHLPTEKRKHRFSTIWCFQSVVGVIGTFFNSFVLYVFYNERKSLLTSVNAMIA